MTKKIFSILITCILFQYIGLHIAQAQVIVKPTSVNPDTNQSFTVNIKNAESTSINSIRLLIPDTVSDIIPFVKSGWNTTVKKVSSKITEIDWSNGIVPSGLQDNFIFSATVPTQESTLVWKTYETFQNGKTVSYDQNPTKNDTSPYAYTETKILDNFKALESTTDFTQYIAIVAIVSLFLSLFALAVILRFSAQKR